MGKIQIGILGGFQGKVGTVVGSTWRGEDIIKALPKRRADNPTELQKIQRLKFKAVSEFLNPLRDLLSRYFSNDVGVKSRYNLATSYHLLNAVEVTDEVATMLFNRVMVSKGVLYSFQNPTVAHTGTEVTLNWEDNSTMGNAKAEDTVHVVFYSVEHQMFFVYENSAQRSALTASITLPANLAGTEVEAYAFLYSSAVKFSSNSVYLGNLVLD